MEAQARGRGRRREGYLGVHRPGQPAVEHAQEQRGGEDTGQRRLNALVAALGGLLAATLFLGVSDRRLPKPASAGEAALAASPSGPGLWCFHGPGGELLDFAPATGQGCR